VERIIGKRVQIDKLNQYFFPGRIEPENITGWGFARYVVSKVGPLAGTLMAVDPNKPKEARFITLGGAPYLIR
jgi:ecotin